MSWSVSWLLAPVAGVGLFTATDDLTKLTIPALLVLLTSSSNSIKSTNVNTFDVTLSVIPLPTVYLTVNVVFDGDCP